MDDQSPAVEVRNAGNHRVEIRSAVENNKLAFFEFRAERPERPRILVVKLDHRGDFLIGLPALERLRFAFPDSHLTLVCGSWNITTAQNLGIADELRGYDFFPETMQGWNGDPVETVDRFRDACRGRFDIALDLRVDEDTRRLLQHVDAAVRCGIGSRSRHPYLDIILPSESRLRDVAPVEADRIVFEPGAFVSRMPTQTPFFHETDFSVTDGHLVYGPYQRLPLGQLRASFGFQLSAPLYCTSRQVEIAVEVVRDGAADVIAFHRVREVANRRLTTVELDFTNRDPMAHYEFRVFIGGRPRRSRLRFLGVAIESLEKPMRSRLIAAELHRGEELALLVELIAERLRPLYPPDVADRLSRPSEHAGSEIPTPVGRYLAVAPFSTSKIKDWPLDRYEELIGLLLAAYPGRIALVGTRGQEAVLDTICRGYGEKRLLNLAGRTDWSDLASVIREAELVIANDTGVAHLSAACGRPTLAIYSGSNQPQEWGPRGKSVRVVTAAIPCSPCGYERLELCPHDHLCMKLIEPQTVLQLALEMIDDRHAADARLNAQLQASAPSAPSTGAMTR